MKNVLKVYGITLFVVLAFVATLFALVQVFPVWLVTVTALPLMLVYAYFTPEL